MTTGVFIFIDFVCAFDEEGKPVVMKGTDCDPKHQRSNFTFSVFSF